MSARLPVMFTLATIASLAGSATAQIRPSTSADASRYQQRSALDADKQVHARLSWLEQQMARETKILEQRLARAEVIRAAALKSFNVKQLNEAESIEQQAFANYAKRMAAMEKTIASTSIVRVPTRPGLPTMKPKAPSSPKPPSGPWKLFGF